MKFLPLAAFLLVCSIGASQGALNLNLDFIKTFHELSAAPANGIQTIDKVTFGLVDTSLFMIQLGKYALYQSNFGPIVLFDWLYNTTQVRCDETSCVEEKIFIELRDPQLFGASHLNLTTDFGADSFDLSLRIPDFFFSSPGYRHTITNNVTGDTSVGEFSYIYIQNAVYGIRGDYTFDPTLGVQVSNIDITLDMGRSTRTVENRYTIRENGDIIDDGFLEVPFAEDLMIIWNGLHLGEPFEPQYEQWAEYVINCGLSGGRSDAGCSDLKVLKERKFGDFAAAI